MKANPAYAIGHLAKALTTSQAHEDAATHTRAGKKIEKWTKIFEGMLSGVLQVGSRTPVGGTPPWATLEVAHGGFATGELLAGGALQPHETELLARLSIAPSVPSRSALNSYFLGDEGIAELQRMLVSGCYRITVPEEGALLVVSWLLQQDRPDQARELLDQIGPFLSRLRFYPVPDPRPLTVSSLVHLQTVGQTVQALKEIKVPKVVQAQREAIQVWTPLFDRIVELFLETLEGPPPTLQTGPDGKPLRTAAGKFFIEGGWPCQHYPEGWVARARAFLKEYRQQRKRHSLCGKPEHPAENFALLRRHLQTCTRKPGQLTGRDVGMIRLILAGIATKRGLPGSARCQELRQLQARQATCTTRADLAPVLVARLSRLPQEDGLDSLEEVLAPVSEDEAICYEVPSGQSLTEPLGDKVRRCLTAPVEILVEMGAIPSGEVLARVTPQITAQVRSASFADPALRRLYGAIYQAFRRRRSLLLLNLESQVKFEELPWVAACNAHREDDLTVKALARQTLEQVVVLAVTAFPQQILPNKLLQEIQALAKSARLGLPLVEEVAADIFMGAFAEKFLRAAQAAGELLEGSLYERYYAISYAQVRQIDDVKSSRSAKGTSQAFVQLCMERAGELSSNRWSVARNGKIIEQEQILTTHNLAVLFGALGLGETLQPVLEELARRCFQWICRRHQQKSGTWKALLQSVKNMAYAWRQMIFFLALAPENAGEAFLVWAADHLGKQSNEFQARFQPALTGLRRALQGLPPEEATREGLASRQFLGWTTEKHWLLS